MPVLLYAAVAVGVAVTFLLPRRWLVPLALLLLVLVPIGFMDLSRVIGRYYTPAVIVVGVWLLRTWVDRSPAGHLPRRSASALLWIPVLALLALSTANGASPATSVNWIAVVGITVVLPYLLGRQRHQNEWPAVQTVVLLVAAFLGLLAASDYFLGVNPWTALFSYDVNEKTWSVFRTRTSLGHPLVTATVASVCAMVALFASSVPKLLRALALVGSVVTLVLAVSRTSVLAVSLGVALGCVVLLIGRGRDASRRSTGFLLTLAGVAFLLVVTNSPLLADRNESTGGAASSSYRDQSTSVALSLIENHWIAGTGPGTSASQFSAVYGGPLENSALQLVLSLGVPLTLVVACAVLTVIARVALRGEAVLAAGIAAFSVSLIGFSAIDVNPALLVLMTPFAYRAGQVLASSARRSDVMVATSSAR